MSDSDTREWSRGWADHQRTQLLRLARLSLAEKLAWLEEADATVRHLQRERARPPADGRPSDRPEP
jgi:hypothetical protein